ncbi:OmpA family protein [uncultured Psychrobacter sp.]|uniref:OmpA family protein n=1 Tax=uncultured Psychrobacter sp. TaxID=259303 RepID=UPI0026109D15|nr:OmpA family protein [uncultured Psychrobacter sp.]
MLDKSRLTLAIIMSSLMMTACQTPIKNSALMNKKDQIVDVSVAVINVDSDGDGVLDDLDQCPATPLNVVVDKNDCPIAHIGIGLKMEYRAFFAKDSSELSPEYQLELDKIAKKLQEYDTATMRIEGHASADEVDKNKKLRSNSLARNRAIIVKNYLIMQHQIDPNRLSTASYGAQRPIASSDTEEGRSMNRRVYGLAQEP